MLRCRSKSSRWMGARTIVVNAENYGERYVVKTENQNWDKHPLLEAAYEYMHVPKDLAFEVTIYSEARLGHRQAHPQRLRWR